MYICITVSTSTSTDTSIHTYSTQLVEGSDKMALTIPAEGHHTFCLGFCPVGSGHTTYTARLLLSLDQDHQAYLDVRVGGRASDASLLFDRREVSPPVSLWTMCDPWACSICVAHHTHALAHTL